MENAQERHPVPPHGLVVDHDHDVVEEALQLRRHARERLESAAIIALADHLLDLRSDHGGECDAGESDAGHHLHRAMPLDRQPGTERLERPGGVDGGVRDAF